MFFISSFFSVLFSNVVETAAALRCNPGVVAVSIFVEKKEKKEKEKMLARRCL